jgi:hypothetical protein
MKNPCNLGLFLGLVFVAGSLGAQGGYVLFDQSGYARAAEERFVRPVSAPYFHEDSFVTSDLRAWYLVHHFYGDSIGGEVVVAALQVRLALTNNLQFVAYKDGYTEFDDTALGSPDGLNDIGAGLKWAFLQDWENQFHAAAGIGYELGLGDEDVLQDTDELRLWASVNKGFESGLHLGATANYILAEDNDEGDLGNADLVTLHFHADYYVCEWFSPVVEVNGYLVTDDNGTDFPLSGVDAVSIAGGEDEDVWTAALGAEVRPPVEGLALRAAYETEISDNTTLFGHRWTLSAVYEF